jgi:hypothetical protein
VDLESGVIIVSFSLGGSEGLWILDVVRVLTVEQIASPLLVVNIDRYSN